MKRIWMIIAAVLLHAPAAFAAEPLIGYVDLNRAIEAVEDGRRAKAELQETFKKKQAELSKREEELNELKKAIEAQMSVAAETPETRAKMVEFETKRRELGQIFMKEQQELAQLEQKALAAIAAKMRAIVETVGKEGGYALILEISGNRLLYAKDHLDLTNEVIRKYNQKYQ